jgi:hypothetical protein
MWRPCYRLPPPLKESDRPRLLVDESALKRKKKVKQARSFILLFLSEVCIDHQTLN